MLDDVEAVCRRYGTVFHSSGVLAKRADGPKEDTWVFTDTRTMGSHAVLRCMVSGISRRRLKMACVQMRRVMDDNTWGTEWIRGLGITWIR